MPWGLFTEEETLETSRSETVYEDGSTTAETTKLVREVLHPHGEQPMESQRWEACHAYCGRTRRRTPAFPSSVYRAKSRQDPFRDDLYDRIHDARLDRPEAGTAR